MKILFVRHGESVDDIEDRYGGWADFDLTQKGKEQIKTTSSDIKKLNIKFEIILTSPLKRALQTTEVLSDELKVPFEVFEYLKERNSYGILSGMEKDEAKKKYPDLVEKLGNKEYVYGIERSEDMSERVKAAFDLIRRRKEAVIIAVTHGKFMKSLFKEILNVNISNIDDGGYVLIDVDRNNFSLEGTAGINYE